MKSARIDIGSIRRQQIVDAAVRVIAEKGLPRLSLSAIEKKVGMSRGQLTYYFKTKEHILLAVFDRTVEMMCRQHEEAPPDGGPPLEDRSWLDVVGLVARLVLQQPPANPEFNALQFTFLSQISHRQDFRRRLADLYAYWRERGQEHLRQDLARRAPARTIDVESLSILVQAIFHGLAVQAAADPKIIAVEKVVSLCLELLETYLWGRNSSQLQKVFLQPPNNRKNGMARSARALANGVHHGRKQRKS